MSSYTEQQGAAPLDWPQYGIGPVAAVKRGFANFGGGIALLVLWALPTSPKAVRFGPPGLPADPGYGYGSGYPVDPRYLTQGYPDPQGYGGQPGYPDPQGYGRPDPQAERSREVPPSS